MVDTIKISALPLDTAPTGNDYVATVDVDTSTTKKVPLEQLSQALDKGQLLSSDDDNLLVQGSDDGIRLDVDNDLKSTDSGNILQVGSDGKVFVPSTGLTLTENRMLIGGAGDVPEEKTNNEVRSFLGLPIDYIKDDIQYVSANQVSWQGSCRDSSNTRDLVLGSATTASLVSPTANTTYNLFVAANTLTDTPVVVWDTGATPAGYTYYRLVFATHTDGIGNIMNFFIADSYNTIMVSTASVTAFNGTPPTSSTTISFDNVPRGIITKPLLRIRGLYSSNNSFSIRSLNNTNLVRNIGITAPDGEVSFVRINDFETDINASVQIFADVAAGSFLVGCDGYYMER